MLNISTKFIPGDYAYFLQQQPIYISRKCDLCNDEKYILFEETNILCPKCKGEKIEDYSGFNAWSINKEPQKITSISIKYTGRDTYSVKYRILGKKKSNDYVFNSIEEATFYRNKLNNVPITNELDIINNYLSKNIYNEHKSIQLNPKYDIGDFIYIVALDKEEGILKPLHMQITEIRATIKENNITVRYKIGNSYNRSEQNTFETLTEAETQCIQLNNQ